MSDLEKTTSQLSEKLCDATSALEEVVKAYANAIVDVAKTATYALAEFAKALWSCLASSIEDKKLRKFYYLSEHGKNARIRKKKQKEIL